MLKISVIGNLGADAKRQTGNFKDFVSFNVAHRETFTDSKGVKTERVMWINCVINWDASKVLPYLTKGAKVYCYGTLRARVFKGRDGEEHVGIDCIVSELELCGGIRPDTQAPQTAALTSQNPFEQTPNQSNNGNEEELPY